MNNFQLVLRNTFALFLSEVFLKAIGFFWTVFLARNLTVSLYGRYNLVNSFVGLFAFLADLGVGLIVIREIARHKEKAGFYLGNSFILNGTLGVLAFIVIVISQRFLGYSSDVSFLIFIAAFTLFLSTLRSVGIFYFDGMEKMQTSALLNSLNTVFLYTFGLLFFSLGYGLSGIFFGMLAGTVASLCITWLVVRGFVKPLFSLDSALLRHLFIEGLPLGLASFASIVYTKIDTVILTKLLGEYSAGIYNAATPFSFALIGLLNVPFVVAVYPTLSRLHLESGKRFKKAVLKSLGFIALWSIPSSVIIASAASLVPLLFGQKYEAAIPLLRLHIFIVPFASLSALLYKVLIVLHKQKFFLYMSLFGAVISIVLNLLFIPSFQIQGAAIAAVATQGILFFGYLVVVLKIISHLKK